MWKYAYENIYDIYVCGEKCIFEIPNLKLIFFKGNALQNPTAQLTLLNTSNGDVNGLNPSTLLL